MTDHYMIERLDRIMQELQNEISDLDDALKAKRRELGRLSYIRSGSERGAEENITAVRNGKKPHDGKAPEKSQGNKGGTIISWTREEDVVLIAAIEKLGQVSLGEATRELKPKLPRRTEGAIRQRIVKLAKEGYLKYKTNGTNPATIESSKKKLEAAA